MAKWIFDHYGSAPWKYSEGCWGAYKTAVVAQVEFPWGIWTNVQ